MKLFKKRETKTKTTKKTICYSTDCTNHVFNEFLVESTEKQDNIHIISDFHVNIVASSDNKISAHLHGESSCPDIRFYITLLDNEVKIVAKHKPDSNNHVIKSFLTLDVELPERTFNNINIEAKNSSIVIASTVKAGSFNILNCNGKTSIFGGFTDLTINSINGSIFVNSVPTSDIKLNLSICNGSINVSLKNTMTANISTKTVNGSCRNHFKTGSIYLATGQITAQNGYIDIC